MPDSGQFGGSVDTDFKRDVWARCLRILPHLVLQCPWEGRGAE